MCRKILAIYARLSSSGLPCDTWDWSKFSWESVDDKKLVVIYNSEIYSLPIVVEQGATSLDGIDVTRDKLREQIHNLMK